jgi:predicted phosphodiesterase
MKILCAGDQHWTTRKPKNRTDDYYQTILGKLKQEIAIAENNSCKYVLFPGDLFDNFKENHLITQDIINILKNYYGKVLCVAGQHDQQFHNPDLRGTALGTLIAADVVTLLTDIPFIDTTNKVAFYGSSWKYDIPEITTPDYLNVLVLHKMIINEKLWAEQEGHTWANHILLKNKFDLIVSGDNHNQFTASTGKKHLINMGSMMRSTIAQVNHTPAVAIYDVPNKSFEVVKLKVAPTPDVMCIEKAEKEKEKKLQLDAFITTLSGTNNEGIKMALNFSEKLQTYCTTNNIDDEVTEIIKSAMGGYNEQH